MNNPTDSSAARPATSFGLTSPAEAGTTRKQNATTDLEIRTAFETLLRLHSAAGEAVAQFAAAGAIRQVIFRPGSLIFVTYQRDARDARSAVNQLGDSKASALMEEIVNLAERMIQLEASLPPARPYIRNLKDGQTGDHAIPGSVAPGADELNAAGIALYLGSGTLWNYLGRTVSRPDLQGKNLYVLSEPELIRWCKWNGATSDSDVDVVIAKVTQYLSTLCPARP
jgi:hypothetical protein